MGWQHDRYRATCAICGRAGIVIVSSDDWGRSARRYEGFENVEPSSTAIGQFRQDRREMNGRCACGGNDIKQGGLIHP